MAKGSVRKKGKKWYYRFYVEDESGRQVQREFAGTESKSETEALLRKAMEEYEAKKFVSQSENVTVGGLLDMWVEEELKPGNLSNGTVMAYKGTVNRIKQLPHRQSKAEKRHSGSSASLYGLPQLRRDKSRRNNGKAAQQRVSALVLGSPARGVPICGIPQTADFLQPHAVCCMAWQKGKLRIVLRGRRRYCFRSYHYARTVSKADRVPQSKRQSRFTAHSDCLLYGASDRRSLRAHLAGHQP